jgi:hypothetical protein
VKIRPSSYLKKYKCAHQSEQKHKGGGWGQTVVWERAKLKVCCPGPGK